MNFPVAGFARLTRPANLPTAAADIFAGMAIAGAVPGSFDTSLWEGPGLLKGIFLIVSSVLLYAGGVVLNDVYDLETDKTERPERPIPSGVVSLIAAATFGTFLLIFGVVMAFLCHTISGLIALILAVFIVIYDAYAKRFTVLGPLNMGICRGLNLVLGMTVLGEIIRPEFALIPLVYIFAITLISRGEVHGENKNHIIWAGILYILVILAVLTTVVTKSANIVQLLPFLLFFSSMIFMPLWTAYRVNSPENIKKAVVAGVLSLIILDASVAVAFSAWWYGILILLLLPLSIWLSRIFAVT
ncbi:MAG TPA: UbiA-like protein EboC [Eudoraea sp.]|nr:UbiA-like protein EboC [Eudoraea sp.]